MQFLHLVKRCAFVVTIYRNYSFYSTVTEINSILFKIEQVAQLVIGFTDARKKQELMLKSGTGLTKIYFFPLVFTCEKGARIYANSCIRKFGM